jgi:hypothetical protein
MRILQGARIAVRTCPMINPIEPVSIDSVSTDPVSIDPV